MEREEFRRRRAALRALIAVLRGGRLELGGSGGNAGMIFIRTPDGKHWFIGGMNDERVARAVLEAVNFALDCCDATTAATERPVDTRHT